MKWQWSLLLSAFVAFPVIAQQPQPAVTMAPTPTFTADDTAACPLGLFSAQGSAGGDRFSGNHNFVNFTNWLSNPLQNIDPRAVTAIYPLFGSEWISSSPPIPNADAQVYGPAITVALSDRFSMGVNQGGYAVAQTSKNPIERKRLFNLDLLGRFTNIEVGGEHQGFLNIGGFFQYTLIEDVENQFLLTAGLRWLAPCGSYEMFQGHGPAELAPYVTVGKEVGKFHVLAVLGYQFPAGPGDDNTQEFYANIHIDRQVCGWLYPMVEFNSLYHTKSVNFGLNTREGFIDFGNFDTEGNIVTFAAGVNAVLVPEHVEIGAFYSTVIASQHNFDANGLGVKMTLRY
jgi:hypothetical protein